jgi:hypothetical protein
MAAAQPASDGTISDQARKIKANQRKHWTGLGPSLRPAPNDYGVMIAPVSAYVLLTHVTGTFVRTGP